jgi:hypothetical protein
MGNIDLGAYLLLIIVLAAGAAGATWIFQLFNLAFTGWIQGIVIAFIQIILLAVVGLYSGKWGILQLVIGTIIIFIGSIVGGFISQFLQFTMQEITTLIIFAIQALFLLLLGIAKGPKTPVVVKS